ncbi:MAG TPA: hypothetical protein IAA42_02250 [Candidatus Olsenella excrementavium]|uniref:Uncharacterized protein n=1 Tax=Candidatus Olsenella excrementavium TaxID=2838709 RepID=A0A9D2CGT7_9ACTN|nr:hypothetical protein [Candidatus Olsenella excrementavium]
MSTLWQTTMRTSTGTPSTLECSTLGSGRSFELSDVDYVVSDGNLTEHFKKCCEEAEVTVL